MSLPTPYYQDGSVTIYHGDCIELLPHVAADVLVTDPPYGVEFKGKRTKHTTRLRGGYGQSEDSPSYVRGLIHAVAEHTERGAVTPGTAMLGDWLSLTEPRHIGCMFIPNGAGFSPWGFQCWQPILYYGKCPHFADGKGHGQDSFSTTERSEPSSHPCPKPIGVMKWIVSRVSRDSDVILDPFMGSGTTLRAAKDLGRKAIGIELEERYCQIAAERCAQDVFDLGTAA